MSTATSAWAPTGVGRYGLDPDGPATRAQSELHSIASPSQGAQAAGQPWHPSNPLFWFGVIAAATFGLMAVSTTVRVGKATGTVAIGSTK